jgi:hypothetical protein
MKTAYQERKKIFSVIPGMWLRRAHEYMFSLNLAWAIVWVEGVNTKYIGGPVVAAYFVRFFRKTIPFLAEPDSVVLLELVVWPFILAVVFFAFLRLSSRLAATDVALRTVAGASAIAMFPLAMWIPSGPAYQIAPYHIAPLEVIVVVVCGVLHYLRKTLLSTPLMLIVLLVHFTIWAWLRGSYFDVFACISDYRSSTYYHPWGRTLSVCSLKMLYTFGFPVIGLLASLTWVRYVRRIPDSAKMLDGPQ